MGEKKSKSSEIAVCEFFGIKITTKNPKLAQILTSDVGELSRLDVKEIKPYFKNRINGFKKSEKEKFDSQQASSEKTADEASDLSPGSADNVEK